MFDAAEIKFTLSVLARQRVNLLRVIDNSPYAADTQSSMETIRLLDGVMQKFARMEVKKTRESGVGGGELTMLRAIPNVQSAQVLVVDDDEALSAELRNLLKNIGITSVSLAKDSTEAIALLSENPQQYAMIFCDWDTEQTGQSLLKYVKNSVDYKHTKVFMMTAHSERYRIRDAIQLGIDDCILKPIDARLVAEKVRNALKIIMEETPRELLSSPALMQSQG